MEVEACAVGDLMKGSGIGGRTRGGRWWRRWLWVALSVVIFPEVVIGQEPVREGANHVLQLDGDGDFVELPAEVFAELASVTVEGWVKWEAFQNNSRFWEFGRPGVSINVQNRKRTPNLHHEVVLKEGERRVQLTVPDALTAGQWFHVASVTGPGGMKL